MRKKSKEKEARELIEEIISLISSGSSVTDILVNSSERITNFFKLSFFNVYILENNVLNCLIKVLKQDYSFSQKVFLENDERNKILNLSKVISEKNELYDFLIQKFNLSKSIHYIFVPVINIGKFIGLIIAGRKNKFKSAEEKNISTIISILASTFSLSDDLVNKRKTENHIEALMIISNAIVEKNNLNDMLKIIVNVVADVMDYKICSIMLYDEERQELKIGATQSLSHEYKSKPNLKIGQSLSGKAIKEKKPITTIDVVKDPLYKYPEIAKKEGLKSMLAVPMIVKNKIIGVINVYTQAEHIFTQDEIKMLTSVANLAAVAILNAQLEEEATKAKDALETRKLIERAKGILMKKNNLTEEEAYVTMRKKAMDLCKPLKEIAEAIILSVEINNKNSGGKDVSRK